MKKTVVIVATIVVLMLGAYFLLPDQLYNSAWGQKLILNLEGDDIARFYFKEHQQSRDTVYMRGVIYANTFRDIKEVFDNNPQAQTLVMEDVPGSIDDEINLLASREIRNRNINTYIPDSGMVASGGTDMFLAGVERSAHRTAKLGIHSWGGGELTALEYPKDHEVHELYLDYYLEMDIPTEFYWYTLEAAPADSIHWMTLKEMGVYKVVTVALDLKDMLSIQKELSSDEFRGREAGDNLLAQELILSYFKSIGLKSFDDSYLDPFSFNTKRTGEQTGNNIIGYIEGSIHKEQYFVIGAHYDHLGIRNDSIYNGADDNASGTAALLTLAKYFSTFPSEHSIIFAAFDAEEKGLLGSKHFVNNPPVDLGDIILNFNFDMISRNPQNEIYVVGTYAFPQFKPIIQAEEVNSPLTISYGHDDPDDKTKDYWMYSSDNGPFFRKGIANITFSEEDHPGYHKPSDDFVFVNKEFYKEVVLFIKGTIEAIDRDFPVMETQVN